MSVERLLAQAFSEADKRAEWSRKSFFEFHRNGADPAHQLEVLLEWAHDAGKRDGLLRALHVASRGYETSIATHKEVVEFIDYLTGMVGK